MRYYAARWSLVMALAVGVGVYLACARFLDAPLLGLALGFILAGFAREELDTWARGPREPAEADNRPWLARKTVRRRLFTIAGTFGLLAWFGLSEATDNVDVDKVRDWIRDLGPLGPLLVIGALALAMIISPIPNVPFVIAAGLAWGTVAGSIYVMIGQFIGASTAFLISRRFGRRFLPRMFGEDGAARLDRMAERLGVQVVFWIRLVPFVSFDWTAYAAGLTSMRYRSFILAAMAGALVPTVAMVYLGESLTGSWRNRFIAAGVFAVVLAVPTVIWIYRNRGSLPRRGEWRKAIGELVNGAPPAESPRDAPGPHSAS